MMAFCILPSVLLAQTFYVGGSSTLYVKNVATTTPTVQINGALQNNGIVTNAGKIAYTTSFMNTGTLNGTGTLVVGTSWTNSNTASVAPGVLTVGTMQILGNYTSGSSELAIELGGTTADTEHDQLVVSGVADVANGVLNVSFVNGHTGAVGESFVVIAAGSLSGTFATVNLPALASPLVWTTDYDNAAGTLTLRISSSLPVKWLSFKGRTQGNDDVLMWLTASEENNRGFEVEAANPSENGVFNWQSIGFVAGSGTTNTVKAYTFVRDISNVSRGSSNDFYYRLRQIDADGNADYSNTIYLQRHSKNKLQLFPNPVSSELNIAVEDREQTVEIIDAFGRTLYQNTTIPTRIDMQEFAAGIYFIKIEGETFKFVKQ